MKQDGTIALFQYWNRLRGDRPAPRRTEIEPADIKSLLADTFILERDARGEPVFRLAGTRLCSSYGRELKGFSFPSLWSTKDERAIRRLTQSIFESDAVAVIEFRGLSQGGRTNPFEILLLPLDGGRDHLRALGAVIPCEKPFWLGADPIDQNHIETIRVVDPEREPLFLNNRPALTVPPLAPGQEFVEDESIRRVRHLVVFEGGRSD